MQNNVFVYDFETISNFTSCSFINRDNDNKFSFVIWEKENQIVELIKFFEECKGLISFNGIDFDANITNYILHNKSKLVKYDGEKIARLIYKKAQEVIEEEWSSCRNPIIPELDLYQIQHFSNPAKMTGLKKLEIALQFENVQDMPIHHTQEVKSNDEVKMILDYNINDVKATKEFYKKTINKIELRKGLKKKYNLDCLNYSDTKIGTELMLKLYCEATNKNISSVRKQRTIRKSFNFNEYIFDYIKFETEEFNGLLNYLKEIEVKELKESFQYEFAYKDIQYFYGTGGLHASAKEGIYESDEEYIIVDADVSSFYPNLAIVNQFYPEHLGKEFCEVYKNDIIIPRIIAKKSGDKVLADGFKLAANSTFGCYNNQYSWLYDARCTLLTTLNGQLSLSMLIEMLHIGIKDLKMVQSNTDGITVKIKRKDKRKYWEICKQWESITKLELEYVAYDKMILRDVNSYISVSKDGKVKRKGVFVLHEEMRENGDWHKAFNLGILPIALTEYFVNNKSIEELVKNHKNIYDFCKTFSVKGKFVGETYQIKNEKEINHQEVQKTIRYYPSISDTKLRKRGEPLAPKFDKRLTYYNDEDKNRFEVLKNTVDNELNKSIENSMIEKSIEAKISISCNIDDYRLLNKYYKYLNYIFNVSRVEFYKADNLEINCEKDWRLIDIESETNVTIFNTFEDKPFEDYKINYDFVISEINKVIDLITGKKERRETEEKQRKENEIKERQKLAYIEGCINKKPTQRIYNELRKDWMDQLFPALEEGDIKKSPVRKLKGEINE